jgi:multidrug efflux pump subunit AcrA (membrane-fusion protein)
MPTAAPADISDPRLDPDQFYARLGRLLAEMMGPMIAQRIQQLMAHRKLEEAVALLDNEDEVARVVSDCSDLLELRILERELETLRRRQQQRNRVQRPRAKTKLRQATRIARQELLVEARANDILYSALEPTFQRIAREAKAEFENYQQSADSKKNVPGLDQLHIISKLIEAAPALFPETIHRAILDDLEALRLGGKPSLLAPFPTGHHHDGTAQRKFLLRGLAHIAFRVGKGSSKTQAQIDIAEAYGVHTPTVRKWENRLGDDYGFQLERHLERTRAEGIRVFTLLTLLEEDGDQPDGRLLRYLSALEAKYGEEALARDAAGYKKAAGREDVDIYA